GRHDPAVPAGQPGAGADRRGEPFGLRVGERPHGPALHNQVSGGQPRCVGVDIEVLADLDVEPVAGEERDEPLGRRYLDVPLPTSPHHQGASHPPTSRFRPPRWRSSYRRTLSHLLYRYRTTNRATQEGPMAYGEAAWTTRPGPRRVDAVPRAGASRLITAGARC